MSIKDAKLRRDIITLMETGVLKDPMPIQKFNEVFQCKVDLINVVPHGKSMSCVAIGKDYLIAVYVHDNCVQQIKAIW